MRTTVILAFLLLSGCCCFLSYEPDISSKKLEGDVVEGDVVSESNLLNEKNQVYF
jgi:hypothetical protein